jgi:hypothetical protein
MTKVDGCNDLDAECLDLYSEYCEDGFEDDATATVNGTGSEESATQS